MGDNKREHFRVVYPVNENPRFLLRGGKYSVSDVSEGGFSFMVKDSTNLIAGEMVEGVIEFGRRGKEKVRGEVLRVDGRKVSIRFANDAKLSLRRIMDEQRFLIQRHKLT